MSAPSSIRNISWAVVRDGKERRHVYRKAIDIHLKDGRISEITLAGARPTGPGETVIDGTGMLALPGLINTHSHPSTEPGYRGVREDHGVPEQQMTGLMERLQAFRVPAEGRVAAATMAYSEMLRAGTTTACDVTVPFDGWLETMAKSGMRFYATPTFASARWSMSSPQNVTWQWDEARGQQEFEKAKRLMDDAESHNSGRLGSMVFPAQIDTVTPELFAAGRKHADDTGRLFSTHICQSVVEVREIIRRHNMTPIQWADHLGLLDERTLLAHCILLDEHPQIRWHTRKDLDLIAEAGASVAHCPQPFARYGLAMDHVGRYRARGVNVGLGTDCAPHNLIEEMRLAIHAGRLMSEDIRTIDTAGIFEAATFGGARALGRDDIGALAPGMQADIVLVDLNHPLMQPVRDPLRSLVFHAADRAVRTVLVQGEVVLSEGEPVHLDPKAAMATMAEAQEKMFRDVPKHDYAGRSGDAISPLSLPVQ
ncbi:MAG TPA: amidohydrolase family protein, partial [Reyranellaceae bacterium]|nr:amidohydrolase family protein [Reyranellaceae bacterium]